MVLTEMSQEMLDLPAYDFPDKCGYVAPGVNLIINEMKEKEIKGRDVYASTDVTVSVTCKPKVCYGSSATNWANDAYKDRLTFPEEHKVKSTGAPKLSGLSFLHGSCKQFLMMTIYRKENVLT